MNATKGTDYETMESVLKSRNSIWMVFIFTMIIQVEAQTSKEADCEKLWDSFSLNIFHRKKDKVTADSMPSIKVYRTPNYWSEPYSPEAQKYLSYAKMVNIKNIAIPDWESLTQEQKESYVTNLKQNFINKADSIQRAETADIIPFGYL